MCDDARHRVLVPDGTGGKLITHTQKKKFFSFFKEEAKNKKTPRKKK